MPLENTGNKIKSLKIYKDKVVIKYKDTKLDIPKEVFTSFYLYEGKDISNKEINEIKNKIKIYELYKYARRIASTHLYSEYRVREKLYLKTTYKAEVDEVINKLKDIGLINDQVLVEQYVNECKTKLLGKNKINAKLYEIGVFPELINNIYYDDKDEYIRARSLLNKLDKTYDKYNNRRKKDKIIAALISKGYELDIALRVSEEMHYSNNKEEENKLKKDYQKVLINYKKKYQGRELRDKIIMSLTRKGYRINDINKILGDKL